VWVKLVKRGPAGILLSVGLNLRRYSCHRVKIKSLHVQVIEKTMLVGMVRLAGSLGNLHALEMMASGLLMEFLPIILMSLSFGVFTPVAVQELMGSCIALQDVGVMRVDYRAAQPTGRVNLTCHWTLLARFE